jgi:hypothetical protein
MGYIHEDVKSIHLASHPQEEAVLKPFLNGFEVTWGRRRNAYNSSLSVYFLKPEAFMAEMFGFSQELMLLYHPYPRLEARTMQAAEQFITDEPGRGRVEKLTYLLVSEAENAEEWIRAYSASNHESRIVVAFAASALRSRSADPWFVRNRFSEQLFSRDLFDFRLPLEKDTYFFGREDLLLDFLDAARRSENRGVFGLRKTGKTSFLFKLSRLLKEDGGFVHYYDCKSPSIRQLHWHELLEKVGSDIADDLNTNFKAPGDKRRFAEKFTSLIGRFQESTRVTLIFDEIEYISPFAVDDEHWRSEYVAFWQTIWAAQSVRRRVSVVIAGVNPSVVEIDRIAGVQNPLFGIVPYKYLRGLGLDETRRMLRVLGRRMGLGFPESGVDYVFQRYGGHPLLTRLACSFVHQRLAAATVPRPVEIDPALLMQDEAARDSELTFYCRHVVSELKDFYPQEYEMLEMLSGGRISDFIEFSIFPEYVMHLKEYGLVREDADQLPCVALPVVARYVAQEEARLAGRRTILRLVPVGERASWLAMRTKAVIDGFGEVQRLARLSGMPPLFGPNSFPESHKFASLAVVTSEGEFESFINCCNRCFVESIEAFGVHQKKPKYFWEEIRANYPALFQALHRIKVYRHNRMHLRLQPSVETALLSFLNQDLEGRDPRHVDEFWFVLQQCALDALLNGLQVELSRLGR